MAGAYETVHRSWPAMVLSKIDKKQNTANDSVTETLLVQHQGDYAQRCVHFLFRPSSSSSIVVNRYIFLVFGKEIGDVASPLHTKETRRDAWMTQPKERNGFLIELGHKVQNWTGAQTIPTWQQFTQLTALYWLVFDVNIYMLCVPSQFHVCQIHKPHHQWTAENEWEKKRNIVYSYIWKTMLTTLCVFHQSMVQYIQSRFDRSYCIRLTHSDITSYNVLIKNVVITSPLSYCGRRRVCSNPWERSRESTRDNNKPHNTNIRSLPHAHMFYCSEWSCGSCGRRVRCCCCRALCFFHPKMNADLATHCCNCF